MKNPIFKNPYLTLSMLSLSLVAGLKVARAEVVEVEALPAEETSKKSVESSTAVVPEAKEVSAKAEAPVVTAAPLVSTPVATPSVAAAVAPVVVAPAMQQQVVPAVKTETISAPQASAAAVESSAQTAGQLTQNHNSSGNGFSIPNIPSSQNSGSGNQIIIVPTLQNDNKPNVQTGQTSAQKTDQASQQAAGDPLSDMRVERARKEGFTDGLLLRKAEEGRIKDESGRQKMVEPLDLSNGSSASNVEVVPVESTEVTPVGAAAGNTMAVAGAVQTEEHTNEKSTAFTLAPTIGHSWSSNSGSARIYQAQNQFIAGAQMTGEFNSFLGVEASFLYGRDTLNANYNGGYLTNIYSPYSYTNYAGSYIVPVRTRDSYDLSGGLKLGYTMSAVRPYLIAGVGYVIQRYNIDDSYTTAAAQSVGWVRATYNWASKIGAGMDVNLDKNFSVGARFDYMSFMQKQASYMDLYYGDQDSRWNLLGNLQVRF